MTMRIVLPEASQAMPWRNGGGTTWEIARGRLGTEWATDGAWDWRLSLAEIASEHNRGVVKQPAAVCFFGRFKPIQQSGQQFALCGVSSLRRIHRGSPAVVAHVMSGDRKIQTLQQRGNGLAIA